MIDGFLQEVRQMRALTKTGNVTAIHASPQRVRLATPGTTSAIITPE
jgi:hypothetical protein